MSVPVVVCAITSFEHPYPLCSWMSVRGLADAYVLVSIPDVMTGEDRQAFTAGIVEELRREVDCPVLFEPVSAPVSLVEARNLALRLAQERFSHLPTPFVDMLDTDQVWEGAQEAKKFIAAQEDAHHILFP